MTYFRFYYNIWIDLLDKITYIIDLNELSVFTNYMVFDERKCVIITQKGEEDE